MAFFEELSIYTASTFLTYLMVYPPIYSLPVLHLSLYPLYPGRVSLYSTMTKYDGNSAVSSRAETPKGVAFNLDSFNIDAEG